MIQLFEAIRRLKNARDDIAKIITLLDRQLKDEVKTDYLDCSIETINETLKVIRDGNENFNSKKR